MTAPTLVNPYQVEQPQQGLSDAQEAALTALALFFASTAAVHATLLPALFVRRLTGLGLSARAVQTAGRMTLEPALTGRSRHGSPVTRFGPQTMVRRMAAQEPMMRARYLLAAATRLTKAAAQGMWTAGLRRERTYLDAHRRAGQRRAKAARAYDEAARGQMYMVWVTAGDSRVDPHCRALAGSVWHVDNPPVPCPGAAHMYCRCVARPLGSHSAAQAAA